MRIAIISLLLVASTAVAQPMYWQELQSPSSSIIQRGINTVDGKIFVKSRISDSTLEVFVADGVKMPWKKATLPYPIVEAGEIVRISDTSFGFVASVAVSGQSYNQQSVLVSARTGTNWSKLSFVDSVVPSYGSDLIFLLGSSPGKLAAITRGWEVYDFDLDSIHYDGRGFLGFIDCTRFEVVAASGDIIYYEGYQVEVGEVSGYTQDRGKNNTLSTRYSYFSYPDKLAAHREYGLFWSPSGVETMGLSCPQFDNGLVLDGAIAPSLKLFVSSSAGVFSANPNGKSSWHEVGALPVVATSIAIIHDTLLVAASNDRIFITSTGVTSDVAAAQTSDLSASYSVKEHELLIKGTRGACRIELIDVASGVPILPVTEVTSNSIKLPSEVRIGVYLYRLQHDDSIKIGKLLIHPN